jgi:serine/threonine protein kinase
MPEDDVHTRAYRAFQEALARSENERRTLISELGAVDAEAAELAARMLREFEGAEEIDPGRAIASAEWASDREGAVVNGWRIEKELSAGGFGRVYYAWRPAPGGKEEAAIKFLDMAPAQTARFRRERQILADLDHEGICRFLDGGTTAGGVPWMAMEYVSGLPITSYCDYRRLTITDRLRLFVKLCRAVEYAHSRRILHRDLKPANILVTPSGAVRVLDFGIAKLLQTAPDILSQITRAGSTLWTRQYASPEQVRGDAVSFATDVYALGVVLYELVTGLLPFSEASLSGADWRQVIADREPLAPSRALLLGAPGSGMPETAAGRRHTSPSRLKRALAGNLDAVILKALRKDPEQRYTHAERLRQEIERWLDGYPVAARRCGHPERARNWAGKNPGIAATATVCALAFVLLFGILFARQTHYLAASQHELQSRRRLRWLIGTGMPGIEDALPRGDLYRDERAAVVGIHRRLVQRAEQLPAFALASLDDALVTSALRCAEECARLGDSSAALAVTEPVLERAARWHAKYWLDDRWAYLYAQLLGQRVEMYTRLGQAQQAAAGRQLLSEVQARRGR